MKGLQEITVLDLTRVLVGPYCTMILGDLGANVIKIEPPEGDDARYFGPPFNRGAGPYFLAVNRNKRSMVLDLRTEQGRDTFLRMCQRADVVVHNYRPGIAERLGIGYEQVRAINPKIIYCSISAFGERGPDRTRVGLDSVMQALSGIMSVTGDPDGKPFRTPIPMIDMGTGVSAALGIIFALYERERYQTGRYIDLSLLRTAIAFQAPVFAYAHETGAPPARIGNDSWVTLSQCFPAADGYITISFSLESHWRKLCKVLGLEEWLADPRFATNGQRMEHKEEIYSRLAEIFLTRTAKEWEELLSGAGIPSGRVRDYDEILADKHANEEGFFYKLPFGDSEILQVISPLGLQLQPTPRTVPDVGQHTNEILREFGFSDEEIEELYRAKVTQPVVGGS